MTQSPPPPVDPSTVAEIAPGEGSEPGSVEYGGSDIHAEIPTGEGRTPDAGSPGAVTTEAGTFEELPVTPEEQGD